MPPKFGGGAASWQDSNCSERRSLSAHRAAEPRQRLTDNNPTVYWRTKNMDSGEDL